MHVQMKVRHFLSTGRAVGLPKIEPGPMEHFTQGMRDAHAQLHHGGRIRVEDNPGGGALFRITLRERTDEDREAEGG